MIARSVCVIGVLLAGATAADAAVIELRHRDPAPPLVVVTGDFEPSDIDTFRKTVAPLKKATVSLKSDGGALVAGIRIGTLIRSKRFATLVPDGALCASACAVAWLGGVKRLVGKDAGVGFHAAYVMRAGTAAESGPGNAILGAYLNQLGLSEKAIRYVTYADPTTIHWMTIAEAAEHEITVASAGAPPAAASRPAAANAVRDYPDGSPERRAIDFVRSIVARWSGRAGTNGDALAALYTDVVLYHGKPLPRDAVLTRKRRLAERQSERSYAIRAPSLAATCTDAGGVCQVKGVMEWEVRNARAKTSARGITSFDYSLVLEGDTPQIGAESGSDAENEKPQAAPNNSLKQVGKNLQHFLAKLSKLASTPRKQSSVRAGATLAR